MSNEAIILAADLMVRSFCLDGSHERDSLKSAIEYWRKVVSGEAKDYHTSEEAQKWLSKFEQEYKELLWRFSSEDELKRLLGVVLHFYTNEDEKQFVKDLFLEYREPPTDQDTQRHFREFVRAHPEWDK